MKRLLPLLLSAALMPGFVLAGCTNNDPYTVPRPPTPPAYTASQALFDLASRNGLRAGLDDGAHDSYFGLRYSARRTPTYREAPGYDPNLGPQNAYVNTFRNAYLRGYNGGYYHHQ